MHHFTHRKQQALLRYCASLLIAAYTILALCSCEREQTTILYGTVTDRSNQPVDSILVVVDGVMFNTYTHLGEAMTDKNGEYAITVTSKKFSIVNVNIPFWPLQNPKFERYYSGYHATKNDQERRNCCSANAGEKTKYDFKLRPK